MKIHLQTYNKEGQKCYLCNSNKGKTLYLTDTLKEITCENCKHILGIKTKINRWDKHEDRKNH